MPTMTNAAHHSTTTRATYRQLH